MLVGSIQKVLSYPILNHNFPQTNINKSLVSLIVGWKAAVPFDFVTLIVHFSMIHASD